MTNITFSPSYRSISLTRFGLRTIEEDAKSTLNEKTSSIFPVLKKYYISPSEKNELFSSYNLFQKIHFYFVGHSSHIDHKIEDQLKREKSLKEIFSSRIDPLDPPIYIQKSIQEIYQERKSILKTLKTTNNRLFYAQTVLGLTTALLAGYITYNVANDYKDHCRATTNEPEMADFHKEHCPNADPLNYFYNLATSFLALPVIILIGAAVQIYDNEIISKVYFSPVDEVKQSASTIIQKVSKIKDYLLEYSLEPSFTRPIFERALNE